MAEPAVTGTVGLARWILSGFVWVWHKITGVEPLTKRIDELERSLKEKTEALATRQEKASGEITAIDKSVDHLKGSFEQFGEVVKLVREDIERQDRRIDEKIRNATWDEVQRLIKLRQEIEEELNILRTKRADRKRE
jgi:hypothetical protein